MNLFRAKTSFGQQSPLIVTKGNGLHAQGWSFWDKDKALACINRNLLIQTIAMFISGMECILLFTLYQKAESTIPFALLKDTNFSAGKKIGIA